MQLQWAQDWDVLFSVRQKKRIQNQLKTIFGKLRLGSVSRELHKVVTTCACEDFLISIYQAKAYLSNQNAAFCQKIAPLRKRPIFRPLICTSPQVPPWTCVSVCTCVCERRAGPTSLARRSLMADEWHSRCLSIFSSKHPWQAGSRGSWEHEVVQRWTVDSQFNWLSWKVKRLCSRQRQHTAVALCRLGVCWK